MEHIIAAILDQATDTYGRPFVARTDAEAVRTIKMEVNRSEPGNMLNTHAQDYSLFKVGTWDDDTGIITGFPPEKIVNCAALLNTEKGN